MTREEAKEYLYDIVDMFGTIGIERLTGEDEEKARIAIDTLADVPKTNVGEWISVKERLPEINQPVLVWTSGDYWLAELHLLDDVFYWDFDTFDLSGEDFNDVVAWMPLPKPYTEE